MNGPLKPAAQYLRMSTDVQRFSIESQAAIIANFAQREGYEVIATYEDAGKSGVTTTHREGLKALMRDIMDGPPYATVLVTDVSRWGRYQDPDEAAHYEFMCRSAGVDIRYCAEGFSDDGSPAAALMKALKRSMAAEYSRQLSDRTRAGQRRAALEGARTGGVAPYGFAREAFDLDGSNVKALSPGERPARQGQRVRLIWGKPEEIATVRRIFRMCVDDVRTPPEIATALNDDGVPHHRGGLWHGVRVKAVLTNEAAIGYCTFDRSRWLFGVLTHTVPKGDWQRVKIMKGVVSQSVFRAAQARIEKKSSRIRIQNDELLEQLRRLWKSEGQISRARVTASVETASMVTFNRRFGSLHAACKLIGYEKTTRDGEHVHSSQNEWSYIEGELRRLLAEKGYLSAGLINECARLPSPDTIRRQFGSLDQVYLRIGYTATKLERFRIARWRANND